MYCYRCTVCDNHYYCLNPRQDHRQRYKRGGSQQRIFNTSIDCRKIIVLCVCVCVCPPNLVENAEQSRLICLKQQPVSSGKLLYIYLSIYLSMITPKKSAIKPTAARPIDFIFKVPASQPDGRLASHLATALSSSSCHRSALSLSLSGPFNCSAMKSNCSSGPKCTNQSG